MWGGMLKPLGQERIAPQFPGEDHNSHQHGWTNEAGTGEVRADAENSPASR